MNDIFVKLPYDLVLIESIEDIRSRPAFRDDIDSKQHKIANLIGDYTFKEQVLCGLKDCHTAHNKGFLAVTEDGLETIIGHVCGKKWGGSDFVYQKRQFNQRREFKQHSQLLNTVTANKDSINSRIKEISERKYGAKWLQASLRNFREICASDVLTDLSKRATRNDLNVIEHRERTSAEIDRVHEMFPNTPRDNHRFEEITIGLLNGLDIFKKDIHALLIMQVSNVLQQLSQKDIQSMKVSDRRKFVDWANEIESKFIEAEELLASGLRFFSDNNVKLLHHLSKDKNNSMKKLKWNLDAGTGKN